MASFSRRINVAAAEVAEDLRARGRAMDARIRELALGDDDVRWPEGTCVETARFYLRNLASTDRLRAQETAQEVLRTLVGETEAATDGFWGTALGQALFYLGAYPDTTMTRATVMRVLGLNNRQHVHYLVMNGLIAEEDRIEGGPITVQSVRAVMHG